jgi:hypothetical protein
MCRVSSDVYRRLRYAKTTENDERTFVAARRCMDRCHVAFSVLAQGENSPYMTEDFNRGSPKRKKGWRNTRLPGWRGEETVA